MISNSVRRANALGWLTLRPGVIRRRDVTNHFYFRGHTLCGRGIQTPDPVPLDYSPEISYCSICSDILDQFNDLNNQFAIDRYATRKERKYA